MHSKSNPTAASHTSTIGLFETYEDAPPSKQAPKKAGGRNQRANDLLSSPSRARTYNLAVNSRSLYQLSYRGIANKNDVFYSKNRLSSKSFQSIIQIFNNLSRRIFSPRPNHKKTQLGWTNSRLSCKIRLLIYLIKLGRLNVKMSSNKIEGPPS
jgi:hypothetical protein